MFVYFVSNILSNHQYSNNKIVEIFIYLIIWLLNIIMAIIRCQFQLSRTFDCRVIKFYFLLVHVYPLHVSVIFL